MQQITFWNYFYDPVLLRINLALFSAIWYQDLNYRKYKLYVKLVVVIENGALGIGEERL